MVPKPVVVISDVHLGPGGPLTTFRDSNPLAALLGRLADDGPTELVLAGDVFDFLQSDGYAGFDAARAPADWEAIARHPPSSAVLSALRAFGARPGNDVTVLSGNHDPELLVPAVRTQVEVAIGRKGTVLWADDTPLRPETAFDAGVDWPVWGRSIATVAGDVWIVHGDRWDPHNAIHRCRVRARIRDGHHVDLPPGSVLVYEVLSRLKPSRHWVDELKPEFPAVFLLLLYLDPETTLAHLERTWGLSLLLVRGVLEARLRAGPLFDEACSERPGEAASADVNTWLAAQLAEELRPIADAGRGPAVAELLGRLESRGPDAGTLAEHRGPGRFLLRAWLRSVRKQDRFQDLAGPDDIPRSAKRFLPEGLRALIAGHTHGPRSLVDDSVTYVNTGTWLPVAKIPDGDLEPWIDRWERGQRPHSRAPRTFARVDPESRGPVVSLWRSGRSGTPRRLAHA